MCPNYPVWELWEEFARADSGVQRTVGMLPPEKACTIGAIKKRSKHSCASRFRSVSDTGSEDREKPGKRVVSLSCSDSHLSWYV